MTLDSDVALIRRSTDFSIAYASIFEYFLHAWSVSVRYLDDDTRVFCEQYLNYIVAIDLVEVEIKTALSVSEAHFQESSDKTTGRDIVTSEDKTFVDELLNSDESIAEVLSILHSRHVAAHLTLALSEGRTAKLELIE